MTRYASLLIIFSNGSYLNKQVVEVVDGKVIRIYPLKDELPSTIWLEGAIQITDDQNAIHLKPYDLANRKSVCETQRILLR